MEQAFYSILIIFLLIGSIYLGFKLIEFRQKQISDKFQTNTAHFLSDLYRIQIKWSNAGEFGYAESIGNLIKFYGNLDLNPKPGGVGLPLTNDSLATQIQLKKEKTDEIKKQLEEMIEFQG